jgi:hypothetical protein
VRRHRDAVDGMGDGIMRIQDAGIEVGIGDISIGSGAWIINVSSVGGIEVGIDSSAIMTDLDGSTPMVFMIGSDDSTHSTVNQAGEIKQMILAHRLVRRWAFFLKSTGG